MAAICNGMAAYGGVVPFCATFLNFIRCVCVCVCVGGGWLVRIVGVRAREGDFILKLRKRRTSYIVEDSL